MGQKFCEIALSLTVSPDIGGHFLFLRKNSRWPPKVAKIEAILYRILCYYPRVVKNSVKIEIALSLTVLRY